MILASRRSTRWLADGIRRRRGRRAAEHPDRRRQPAVAQHARPGGDRDARAREGSRQAAARRARRPQRRRARARRRVRRAASTASPASRAASTLLDGCSTQQSYRLAHWRVASEEINYRRFFDVNQLAALRMEDPAVFDEVHRFVFELVAPRRRDRPAHRSRRRPVRAGRLPAAAAGAMRAGAGDARRAFLHRRREDPRRRRAAAAATGRCTARPATSSRRSSTACSSTGATSGRSTTSTRASSASAASGCRSTISPIAARSRCCTKRCRATSTRSAIS